MARVLLSETRDWELVDRDQDIRGWEVRDAHGNPIGEVADMIIDVESEHVDTVVLEDGSTFRAADVHLANHVVYVDSYGAPAGARPYAEARGIRRRDGALGGPAVPPPSVRREPLVPDANVPPYADYEKDFEAHYHDAFRGRGLDYVDYAPAYRFGYDMGYDDRYRDRDFGEVEGELREGYYRRHGYPMSDNFVWHDVRDAVLHAYDRARGLR